MRINAEAFETYYDSIEISEASADKNFKYAITARNRDMIDRSDTVVVYVKTNQAVLISLSDMQRKMKRKL